MDKRASLKIQIEHSFQLTDEAKGPLYHRINSFSDEEVEILGKLLAEEKKQSMESIDKKITDLESVIDQLDIYLKKNSAA